jgi:hypothetical protein
MGLLVTATVSHLDDKGRCRSPKAARARNETISAAAGISRHPAQSPQHALSHAMASADDLISRRGIE